MRGLGGSTLRGGQTVFHGLRMWGQLVQAAMMLAAFMVVAVPAWNLWRTTSGAEWYAAGMYTLAEVKLVLGYEPGTGQEIRFPDGTRCQRRSKISPPGRSKTSPLNVMRYAVCGMRCWGVVPVDPRCFV